MASQTRPKFKIALYPTAPVASTLKSKARIQRPEQPEGDVPFSVERVFFLLRWLVVGLGLAIQLYIAGSSSGGVEPVAHALQITALIAVLTGCFGVARYYFGGEEARTWLAVLDALAVSIVIGLDRGIYSPYQFLPYIIIAEAALIFSASNILTFTAFVGAVYAGSVLLISGQKWSELTITIVMSQVVAMFIIASISGSMVRAIKHQRELARREQALSAQLNHQVNALSALNRLSERLNASLDLDELMQNTMEALPNALEVDACVGLLASQNTEGKWQLGSIWYAIDEAFTPAENVVTNDESNQADLLQLGPLVLSRADLEEVLTRGVSLRFPVLLRPPTQDEEANVLTENTSEPAVLVVPLGSEEGQSGALALLRQGGPAFEQSDQELLAALGRQLSVLIKNARLYELERQQVVRLQELEQAKSDFISAVSHELRTPLTSIKASTVLLLSQQAIEPDDTALTLFKNIDRNTDRLSTLVTDLLDLAKLQNGRLRLSLRPTSLREVVSDVVTSLRPLTDNKQQIVRLELPERLPLVLADRHRAEQIITNLVSNAQRYTPRGGLIDITIQEIKTPGQLVVKVSDNGPGIDPAEQKLIFEKFYRSQRQSSKNGTGLGLTIARSLVELHGGQIWVESQPGAGSSFYFSLPVFSHDSRVQSPELVAQTTGISWNTMN
jgi:K+-sensing histidine kinase KdpD